MKTKKDKFNCAVLVMCSSRLTRIFVRPAEQILDLQCHIMHPLNADAVAVTTGHSFDFINEFIKLNWAYYLTVKCLYYAKSLRVEAIICCWPTRISITKKSLLWNIHHFLNALMSISSVFFCGVYPVKRPAFDKRSATFSQLKFSKLGYIWSWFSFLAMCLFILIMCCENEFSMEVR